MNRRSVSGSSSTPILVFLGIVGLSALFFLVFTGRTPKLGRGWAGGDVNQCVECERAVHDWLQQFPCRGISRAG